MINTIPSHVPSTISFQCREKIGKTYQEWEGCVKSIHNHGSHYEIQIQSRSGFTFMVGNCTAGAFISIPDYNVGCELASYGDYFWNNERLSRIMNRVDAATVAQALQTLAENNYL